MRLLIPTLLGIALLIGLFFYFGQQDDLASMPGDEDNLNNASWQSYESNVTPEILFTVQHPPSTTVSQVQDTIFEIKYVGPRSEPNTEITDGYYASVVFREESDLQAYIRDQYPDAEVQSRTFNGQNGYEFTAQSQLGNQTVSHIAYRAFSESDWIIDIGYSVYSEQTSQYRNELLEILRSIEVTLIQDVASDEMTLRIAMLDHNQSGDASESIVRGCDHVVFIEEVVEATTTPLNAALNTLFQYQDTEVGGWQNFIAQTNDTLQFERAVLEDGIASIYLTGELSGLAGVCDNPRAHIQIEETALQFESVDEVVLYLNGEETDLQPSERGE